MRIAIGNDHAATALKFEIMEYVKELAGILKLNMNVKLEKMFRQEILLFIATDMNTKEKQKVFLKFLKILLVDFFNHKNREIL